MIEIAQKHLRRTWRQIIVGAIASFVVSESVFTAAGWGVLEAATNQRMPHDALLSVAGVVTPLACITVFVVAWLQIKQAIQYLPLIGIEMAMSALTSVTKSLGETIPLRDALDYLRQALRRKTP